MEKSNIHWIILLKSNGVNQLYLVSSFNKYYRLLKQCLLSLRGFLIGNGKSEPKKRD